jgi:hypothetical protein
METAMPEGHFEEAKAIGRLPNLDIEINYSRSPAGDAERLSITIQAMPSFEAFGRFLEATNPFLFWMRLAETAWTPWFGLSPVRFPRSNLARLPPGTETAEGK